MGERRRINFIEGGNVTLTVTDDAGNEEVDVTIATSSSGVSDGDKGDITVSSSGAVWNIDAGVVGTTELADAGTTYAKIQDVSAASRLLGRGSAGGAGDVEEITLGTGLSMTGTVLAATAAAGVLWGKITNDTPLVINAATAATINRIHIVSGTSTNYDIDISSLSPSAGDVVAFYVEDHTAADKAYRLDAGSGNKINGNTRYLTLLHTNVVLLRWDGAATWRPLVFCLDTPWVNATLTIQAVTSNPTKGTNTEKTYWRRVGAQLQVSYHYEQTGGGTAGTGMYLIVVPIGVIDTAKMPTGDYSANTSIPTPCGYGVVGNFGTANRTLITAVYDTTRFFMICPSSATGYTFIGQTSNGLNLASVNYQAQIVFIMVDW